MQLELRQVIGRSAHLAEPLVMQNLLNLLREPNSPPIYELVPGSKVELKKAMLLWIYAYILERRILSASTLMLLLQMYAKDLLKMAGEYEKILEDDLNADLPPRIIAVADRRLLTITGIKGCFDIVRCQRTLQPPRAFEGISYNMAVPILWEWARIQKELRDGNRRAEQASALESRYPGGGLASDSNRSVRHRDAELGPGDDQPGAGGAARP